MSNETPTTPAGWYPLNPEAPNELRYWDGAAWTDQHRVEHVADEPVDEDHGGLRPDIEEAKKRMTTRIGAGREIKKLVEHLWENETVVAMTSGQYGGGTGLLVQTDRRLLFTKDGIGKKVSEDFPFDKISSIQWSSGMVFGSVVIFVSGNKAEITNVAKKDGKVIVDAVRARISNQSPTVATPAPASAQPAVDPMEQLRKLAELRDAGVVSAEEFEAKKVELLARL